jgi:hypothetical protein
MHEDFKTLLIDTFNLSINDPYLAQMTLNLIVRYYSEKAEFVRNIDRMVLLFDEKEYIKYQYIHEQLNTLNRKMEKSELWLK